jgi:hypothetical protein
MVYYTLYKLLLWSRVGRESCELTRTVLPALFLDQMLHFRRAVTRMLWPIGDDLLLARFAPDIVTTCLWTFQVLCFFEFLLVEETGAGAPRWRC